VEIDLSTMIDGKGWRWWNVRIHRLILFFVDLSRSIETRPEDGLPGSFINTRPATRRKTSSLIKSNSEK
jgi:hypothetical protein